MRAALLRAARTPVEIVDDLDVEAPRAGEALVAVTAAGVCGTDLAVRDGAMPYPMPVVLGHEAVGTVVATGPGTPGPGPGDRVVLWMRPPCRACRACLRGDAALCERSGSLSAKGTLEPGRTAFSLAGEMVYRGFGVGAFSEQLVMPVAGLVPLPDDVPDHVGALLGCGVATGAGAVLNVARPAAGDVVVVFGGGGVGIAAALAARAVGAAQVIVVDPVEGRRRTALELGVTAAVPGGDYAALREQLGGVTVDVAVDAAGRPELVEAGWRLVRQGGTVVAVGIQPAGAEVSLPGSLVALSQRRILGCYMGGIDPHRDLPRLMALYRAGVLPLDRLVTARRPLAEAPQALDDLAAGRGVRTVLEARR